MMSNVLPFCSASETDALAYIETRDLHCGEQGRERQLAYCMQVYMSDTLTGS